MSQDPKVISFVVRFVFEEPTGDPVEAAGHWYSVVRQVQSDSERHFTSWEEIVSFFQKYVDLSKGAKDE